MQATCKYKKKTEGLLVTNSVAYNTDHNVATLDPGVEFTTQHFIFFATYERV